MQTNTHTHNLLQMKTYRRHTQTSNTKTITNQALTNQQTATKFVKI